VSAAAAAGISSDESRCGLDGVFIRTAGCYKMDDLQFCIISAAVTCDFQPFIAFSLWSSQEFLCSVARTVDEAGNVRSLYYLFCQRSYDRVDFQQVCPFLNNFLAGHNSTANSRPSSKYWSLVPPPWGRNQTMLSPDLCTVSLLPLF
jgi:hypothetical protein